MASSAKLCKNLNFEMFNPNRLDFFSQLQFEGCYGIQSGYLSKSKD